jgi:acyl transferase domain-containing protein/thioesterase domain-containing protein/acyl carrier protein
MTTANAINMNESIDQSAVAIIGMAGRFPGANSVEELWHNVKNGLESIAFFSDEELLAAGVSPSLINNPNYVKASPILPDLEKFDAFFFDYSGKEALYMDPQQRVFLECAWEALENAGYPAGSSDYTIGIYGGSSISLYLLNDIIHGNQVYAGHLTSSRESLVFGGNVPESLTTRVAYKLNLTGPAIHLSTACSTSLVAVHTACQSLLNGECEIALAGGVSYLGSQKEGYLYEDGLVLSPDGHCRSFDAQGKGTLWGNGVGIVVLKMLDEALADGDYIHAVVKGSAVNNDGNLKVSHSAPSVDAQAKAIYQAQDIADIDPETVTYIEAHGTATPLGDPIEIAALTQAFRAKTDKKGYCAIASLKSNIGHLSEASGIAGLIKTALALKHQQIPPSLHFETPNPQIDFENSPFYVNTQLKAWKSHNSPRRAGVSSFGMGGTNAHVVLEEWDRTPQEYRESQHPQQLLLLSAKTPTALETLTTNLANHLDTHPELHREDVAYTLALGRKAFDHRRVVILGETENLKEIIVNQAAQRTSTNSGTVKPRFVVFMFSGQGSQYVNMGRGLYETEAVFQKHLERCCELLLPHIGLDLRQILYPTPEQEATATAKLKQTALTQPALFAVEYALAQLWLSWGIEPAALIGHSIGEYVAATLAEVFSLEDALMLVAKRGQLMQSLPAGAMLAVPLPESEVKPLLQGTALEIATINSPTNCVVSGPTDAIDSFAQQLADQGLEGRRLHTSHAFHSAMMESILEPFRREVEKIQLQSPTIPFVSNLTGTWITPEAATNPNYYVQHLRSCVRFAEGLTQFFDDPDQILLEVGPGRTLSTLAKRHPKKPQAQITATSLRHPQEDIADITFLLKSLGQLWLAGVEVDWQAFYGEDQHYRVPLPTYPFERQRYWIEPKKLRSNPIYEGKKSNIADWFYQPSWKRANLPKKAKSQSASPVLLFSDEMGLGSQISQQLSAENETIITVQVGEQFAQIKPNVYTLNPSQAEDYRTLIQTLQAQDLLPQTIFHLWTVTPTPEASASLDDTLQSADRIQNLGFYSLLYLTQALGQQNLDSPLNLLVVSNHLQLCTGEEAIAPTKATLIGPVRVISQEYAQIHSRSIDIALKTPDLPLIARQLIDESHYEVKDQLIAYRGYSRWVEVFEPTRLEAPDLEDLPLKQQGVYLITGGMGGMGLVFAEYLAQTVQAKLILTARSPLPERAQWQQWLTTHTEDDPTCRKIQKIQQFEAWGAKVLILGADVANAAQMADAIATAQAKFGEINGVIHAAGVPGGGVMQLKSRDIAQRVLNPKVAGTLILDHLLQNESLDFMVLCSSLESTLGTAGQIDYCGANNFLDTYAQAHHKPGERLVLSINWDAWQKVGMAVETAQYGLDNKILEIKALDHHLFDRCIVEKNQTIYLGTIDPKVHWIVGEHIVLNLPSLVGTAYLEIARSVYELHSNQSTVELQDVYFLQFLFVEEEKKELRVILKPEADSAKISFFIQALNAESGEWVEHAQGKIVPPDFPAPVQYNLEELEASCDRDLIVPDLQALPDYTHYGPRWLSNIKWRKANDEHNLALMELPAEFAPDLEQYKFHPSMVDTATYVVADVLPNELTSQLSFFKADSTYLPYFYERVQMKGALPRKFYSYTIRKLKGRDWSINLSFINADGVELVAINNYVLKYTDSAYSIKENQDARQAQKHPTQSRENSLTAAILPEEGIASLTRILQSNLPQIVVSTLGIEYQRSLLKQGNTEDETEAEVLFERPQLSQAYAAPQTETEKAIASVWEQVLGIKGIGIHDNFFDLGGDSLIIVQILQKLRQTVKADLTINDLLNANTIAELAQIIDPKSPGIQQQLPPCIVKFREGSPGIAPLFLVHPIAGTTRNYVNLPTCLPPNQPLYGIQHPKWTNEPGNIKTIEDLAAYYLNAVRQIQPQGPYFLGGYSGGVYATYEMAQQLTATGEEVAFLALIDKPHWQTAEDKPNWNNPDFGTDLETMVYYADIRTPKPNGESHLSDYLQLKNFDERLKYFLKNSPWIQDMMPTNSTDEEWRTFWEIFVELRIMNVNYDLKPYQGQAVYIAAEIRDIYRSRFHEKPWFKLIPNLAFEEVPGDHITMWHQPHIQVLSQTLQKYANTKQYPITPSRKTSPTIELSSSFLLEAAQQKTGLNDFGDTRFLLGLEQLLAAVKSEAELHLMGQKFMQELLIRLLVNRLYIQAELKQHPDILNTPIQQPLFILGLPRTGSTYLHNLLCQDPSVRWLSLWEAYTPYPSPHPNTYDSDPRIKQTQETFKNYEFFTPESTAMHKYDACAPEECVWLLQNEFACMSFSFLTQIPSYTAWLKEQDMKPVYQYYRASLQLLDWKFASDRWVLKNPFHLGDLEALKAVFPDARFIQTHRSPARVVASYCRLIKNLRPVYSDRLDPKAIGQEILDILARQVEQGMQARQTIDSSNICDVSFSTLVNNPIDTVKQIYQHFDYQFSSEMKQNLQQYIHENPRYKHGKYSYSLEEFGLDYNLINQAFESYIKTYKM